MLSSAVDVTVVYGAGIRHLDIHLIQADDAGHKACKQNCCGRIVHSALDRVGEQR